MHVDVTHIAMVIAGGAVRERKRVGRTV